MTGLSSSKTVRTDLKNYAVSPELYSDSGPLFKAIHIRKFEG